MVRGKVFVLAAVAAGIAFSTCSAQDLVYTPINPSFGGNPLNSAHLIGLANAQRDATASDANTGTTGTGTGGTGTSGSESDVDLFIRQLQGRLLSALASQVTEAIFGENPQDNGTIQFGGTTVTFERTVDSIKLTIVDEFGTVTVITVPQLVSTTNADATSLLGGADLSSGSSLSGSLSPSLSSGSLTSPLN